jgi:peroxiredoxin
MSLRAKLDAFKADFEAGRPPYSVPSSVIETMHRGTAELKASGQAERAPKVGDRAPGFALPDAEGAMVRSAELLARGPLVVSFYRGVWCPYCNMELQALEAFPPQIMENGGALVAISPQSAANSRKSARQNGLSFPILSDQGNQAAASFGLRYSLPDYLVELYQQLGNNLPLVNGDPSWSLPIPARYVIGRDSVIRYAEVDADYTRRPEPEDMLPGLRAAAVARAA